MSKIITLTLNSAIEEVAFIDDREGKEKILDMKKYYTGKAVNTGLVLSNVGCKCEMVIVCGENTCEAFSDFSNVTRLVSVFPVLGDTRINRTNVYIGDREEKIINKGYCMSDNIAHKVFQYVIEHAEKDDLIMIAGSLPEGVTDCWYCELIVALKKMGAKVLFDAAGSTLVAGVKNSPFYIKPNEEEIRALIGNYKQENLTECIKNISKKNNIENVIVSLGKKGVMGYNSKCNELYQVFSEQEFGSNTMTTGCGDSFNAGFIYGTVLTKSFLQSLIYGVAFASANLIAGFPEKISMDIVEECVQHIKYQMM